MSENIKPSTRGGQGYGFGTANPYCQGDVIIQTHCESSNSESYLVCLRITDSEICRCFRAAILHRNSCVRLNTTILGKKVVSQDRAVAGITLCVECMISWINICIDPVTVSKTFIKSQLSWIRVHINSRVGGARG
jgi:hypothetical protein